MRAINVYFGNNRGLDKSSAAFDVVLVVVEVLQDHGSEHASRSGGVGYVIPKSVVGLVNSILSGILTIGKRGVNSQRILNSG